MTDKATETTAPLPAGQHRFSFGALELIIETPPSFDELLDRCARETPDNVDRIPYYATLWPSALALARALAGCAFALNGSTVIEMGCGLGLPSIVAARCGARVVATDFHPDSAAWLRHNANLNQAQIDFVSLDWNNPQPLAGHRFDWIIGSDLLYEQRHIPALVRCISALRHGGTMALIADPGRHGLAAFTEALATAGWHCELEPQDEIYIINATAAPSRPAAGCAESAPRHHPD